MQNKLEKFIYDLVKTNPKIKDFIRDIYQRLLYVVPKKKIDTDYNVVCREGYFYGFHDKIPWSNDNSKLLAHKFFTTNPKPKVNDKLEIGYFEEEDFTKFVPVAETYAWNWTQGSMLQWIGKKDEIIFNDFDFRNKAHVSKIYNIDGELLKELPKPIGAVSPDGTIAVGYSFERLRKGMPGYGYANGKDFDEYENLPDTHATGIYKIDIQSSIITNLFSLKNIANIDPNKTMEDSFHYFTHCLFSPDNERFLFMHRWVKFSSGRRYSRLISSNLDGKELFVFPTDGMVSHFSWFGNSQVIAYANTKQKGDGYYIFKDKTSESNKINHKLLNSDGHPQVDINRSQFVTDTYTNRFRIQHLYVYNLLHNDLKQIAKIRSPLKFRYKQACCDLHPRWDRVAERLCFDSSHTGNRALCTINLKSLK